MQSRQSIVPVNCVLTLGLCTRFANLMVMGERDWYVSNYYGFVYQQSEWQSSGALQGGLLPQWDLLKDWT